MAEEKAFFGPTKFTAADGGQSIRITVGGGWMLLAAAGLATAGLVLCALPFWLDYAVMDALPAIVWLAGGSIAVLGVWLLLSRYGYRIDGERGRIVRWWGLLLPVWTTEVRGKVFDRVVVRTGLRRLVWLAGYECFCVTLEGEGESLCLGESLDWGRARSLAEVVGRALDLPMEDHSAKTGPEGQVERIIMDGLPPGSSGGIRGAGGVTDVPELPHWSRLSLRVKGDKVKVQLPPTRSVGWWIRGVCGILVGVGGFVLAQTISMWFAGAISVAAKAVGWLWLGSVAVFSLRSDRPILIVSPTGIRIIHRNGLRSTQKTIRAPKIENITCFGEPEWSDADSGQGGGMKVGSWSNTRTAC